MMEEIGYPPLWIVRLLKERGDLVVVRKRGCEVVGTCSRKGRLQKNCC